MERIPTPRWDTNRLRLLLTACMILLMVGAGTVVVANHADNHWSFEGASLGDEWNIVTQTNTIEQDCSNAYISNGSCNLHIFQNGVNFEDELETIDSGVIDDNETFTLSFSFAHDDEVSGAGRHSVVGIRDGSETLSVGSIYPDDATQVSLRGSIVDNNESATGVIPKGQLHRIDVISTGGDIIVEVNDTEVLRENRTGSFDASTTEVFVFSETFDNADNEMWVDNITTTSGGPSPSLDQSLSLDVTSHMRPDGSTSYYSVTFEDGGVGTDVTDHANTTVTSSNDSTLRVEESDNSLTSTTDQNVSEVVTVTANFTDSDGINHTTSENVTVATATMDNWGILPSWVRVEALFSFDPTADGAADVETNMVWIILAVFVGMAFTTIASSFAGIGVTTLIVTIGWFWGQAGGVSTVGTGVMLAALFGGLFIGLNLAANIDYAMTRGGGVEG